MYLPEEILIPFLWTLFLLLSALLVLQAAVVFRLRKLAFRRRDRDVEAYHRRIDSSQKMFPSVDLPPFGSVIKVEMGDEQGYYYKLKPKGSTWIGRDNIINDVVLNGSSVSRRHMRIETDGTNYYIHDLYSTNGTYINGNPVSTSLLRHGDTITLGNIVLRFIAGPPEGAVSH